MSTAMSTTVGGAAALPIRASLRRSARRRAFAGGVRDITPMVLGVVPFGVAVGAAAVESGMSTATGLMAAVGILAGAAQLTTIHLLDDGTGPAVIILSALVINARILLYSLSIAPWFRGEPLGRRLLLAVPVIDQLHLTCLPRFEQGDLDRDERRAYYAGAASFLVIAWVSAQAVAMFAGARLPEGLGLEIAAPLALVGLLAKSAVGRQAVAAAGVAGAIAVAGVGAPFNVAILAGCLIGIAVGSLSILNPAREPEEPT